MPRQPVSRCEDQPFLLRHRDAVGCPAKIGLGIDRAAAYFDEHGIGTLAADKIYLAALDAKIARQNPQAVRNKMARGDFLAGIADLLRAVGDNGSHE